MIPTMTRTEYLNAPREQAATAHRAYYGQFVTPATIEMVVRAIGADRLRASTDPHMDDIPLRMWDVLAPGLPGSSGFKEAGDFYTLAGGVCLAKEAARQWLESQA